jgi:flagellar biosynthesis protein FlhG
MIPMEYLRPSGKHQVPYGLAVVSGKGGVGKTNTSCNLAIQLAGYGKQVLLFDADLGLANVDVLLGLMPKHTIQQALDGKCSLEDVLLTGPNGITILPACSGIIEMTDLKPAQVRWLGQKLRELARRFDYFIIDSPSGISANMQIAEFADEVLLVTTPEPTAIMDAYAVAKIFSMRRPEIPLNLVVNMISEHDTAEQICSGFLQVASRFLDRKIESLAQLPYDPHVPLAVRRQQAFTLAYPDCPASRSLRVMSMRLLSKTASNLAQNAAPKKIVTIAGVNRIAPWLKRDNKS